MSLHLLLDPLCCLEDHLSIEAEEEPVPVPEPEEPQHQQQPQEHHQHLTSPLLLLPADELQHLLSSKQSEATTQVQNYPKVEPFLAWARREATQWVLRASSHFGFTAQTSVLAVDYLDRFFSNQKTKERQPWMAQLSAVACLSLAAKVEETHVPLLLDLQVEESRYVFEAKTVQRMELLVLSTLGWRMNPATPISFVDQIVRSEEPLQKRCHSVLLSVISDSRWVEFPPSILAAATILRCLEEFGLPCDGTHLLSLLNTSMEEMCGCSRFIAEAVDGAVGRKRKLSSLCSSSWSPPQSPRGVVSSTFSCESSGESWEGPLLKSGRA